MIRPPGFWAYGGGKLAPRLLSPIAALTARMTAHRVARPGFHAAVPVICCGNATVGGAGKTITAIDLAARLSARGIAVHLLTRGFGRASAGLLRVDPKRHRASDVGDEPLLLAAAAPTWVCADRANSARAAVDAGAQLLVMDDGMQNPSLHKDLSLLIIDGASGFGNGRLLPAGPLREPVRACAARASAAILIGEDRTGARAMLPDSLPVLLATLEPDAAIAGLRHRRAFAFAGIGHPEKFFAMLERSSVVLAGKCGFADHHPYTRHHIQTLLDQASALDAALVTTQKDHVRIDPDLATHIIPVGVTLAWEDEAALDACLAPSLP
jgi:tetraacyldisaccharide 4'-kinase